MLDKLAKHAAQKRNQWGKCEVGNDVKAKWLILMSMAVHTFVKSFNTIRSYMHTTRWKNSPLFYLEMCKFSFARELRIEGDWEQKNCDGNWKILGIVL